ncbi:cytochrome c1 [Parerythrobacter aestuarii]|uniref:cytochrome c1 n=1 Tax=Parerythrobacter aestuarii TaxID=3020909 RepID=UPI0024DE97EA|nr:cytochrome c1 [Parerythrobacter aestuarii]
MIRLFSIAAGLVFTFVVMLAFVVGAYTAATEEPVHDASYYFAEKPIAPAGGFSFNGPLGKWDYAQLQRGLKVYNEVCSACHSLKYVPFRDLEKIGYTEGQVKAFAATKQVPGINPDTGENELRPGLATDYFPSPYANDVEGRLANNNALPPDLSLMTKARKDGTNYVYSLLIGYGEPSEELKAQFPEFETPAGLHFNPYFPNLNLAMTKPLTDGQVTYDDGTEATVDQMAQDVAAFMTWTAEPSMVKRKQTGWAVMIFLLFATVLAYFSKQQIWAAVKPKKAK